MVVNRGNVDNEPFSNIGPLTEGSYPSHENPGRRSIDVKGRKEHEEWLKDPKKCKDAGLDHTYEVLVYLRRWGGWLND